MQDKRFGAEMAADLLVVKLFLLTAKEIDFVLLFGKVKRRRVGVFDLRNRLRECKFFSFVTLLHQMSANIHFGDSNAFLVISIAS